MRPSRLTSLVALAALLAAGCSGPSLVIRARNGTDQGKVYLRPTHDREGNEFPPNEDERLIGELPTEWEVPESLLGGRAVLRFEYADGAANTANISIQKSKDTRIEFNKPAVPRK